MIFFVTKRKPVTCNCEVKTITIQNIHSNNKNLKKMKNLTLEQISAVYIEYVMTSDEMIRVKGGDGGEPIVVPNPPRPKI